MRQFFLINSLIILLLPLSLLARQEKGFEINGHIDGLQEGERASLFFEGKKIDSCIITGDRFHLTGIVPEGPRMIGIGFSGHRNKSINLFVDNGESVTIRGGDPDIIPSSAMEDFITIEGSPSNFARASLINADMIYYQFISTINRELGKIADSAGADRSLTNGLIASKRAANNGLYWQLLRHPSPNYKQAIPFLMDDLNDRLNHIYFIKNVYDSLDERAKNSYYGKILRERAILSEGQFLPDFTLPDPAGKTISLKEVVNKGKITLVHFWASNSYKRKEYQQQLRSMFDKYHKKGFNIIAVSSDTSVTEWIKKIQMEQFPWENVVDRNGKEGIVEKIYHEFGDPKEPNTTNVLIDARGKIVAWDPYGTELEWELKRFFGE